MAKRIDVHPMAEQLFDRAEVVFFGIEGCMKADSILAKGEAVLSVPAVWQWAAPELKDFVDAYLTDKLVVIVPDSDWCEEQGVIHAASKCQLRLSELNVNAIIAAPPPIEGAKVGVDDHLGKYRGRLEDLEVITYAPDPLVVEYIESWPAIRWDAKHNAVRVLQHLAIAADDHGHGKLNRARLARELHVDVKTVAAALDRLVGQGAVTVTGDRYKVGKAYRVGP